MFYMKKGTNIVLFQKNLDEMYQEKLKEKPTMKYSTFLKKEDIEEVERVMGVWVSKE